MALKRHQAGPGWSVSLETLDDIEFNGKALVQAKHRAGGTVLTDKASDLWKSLRIWSTHATNSTIDLSRIDLLLVTTATAAPGSICEQLALLGTTRDNTKIRDDLASIAETLTNKELASSTREFLKLSDAERLRLVSALRIVDGSPDVTAVDGEITGFVRLMAAEQHVLSFLERLEGWWMRVVTQQLVSESAIAVDGLEFDAFLTELREQFHADNLPIDDDVLDLSPAVGAYGDRAFCRQLELLGLSSTRVAIAVRDYHRAYVQRSIWTKENLLRYGELGKYERRLQEEWELHFEAMSDELGEEAAESERIREAKKLYAWAETAVLPIRPACTEGFVSRGSFQMLADDKQVGWHPDFELLLVQSIEGATK